MQNSTKKVERKFNMCEYYSKHFGNLSLNETDGDTLLMGQHIRYT